MPQYQSKVNVTNVCSSRVGLHRSSAGSHTQMCVLIELLPKGHYFVSNKTQLPLFYGTLSWCKTKGFTRNIVRRYFSCWVGSHLSSLFNDRCLFSPILYEAVLFVWFCTGVSLYLTRTKTNKMYQKKLSMTNYLVVLCLLLFERKFAVRGAHVLTWRNWNCFELVFFHFILLFQYDVYCCLP